MSKEIKNHKIPPDTWCKNSFKKIFINELSKVNFSGSNEVTKIL